MSWQEIETQARATLANIQDISRLRSLEDPKIPYHLPAGFADTAEAQALAYVMRIVHLAVTSRGQRKPTVFINGVKQ